VVAGAVALAAVALLLSIRPARRVVQLPAGVVELHTEMQVDGGTDVRGAPTGTLLRAASDFHGRALIVVRGSGVSLQDFALDGNRQALDAHQGLPPYDRSFAQFTRGNGILAEGVSNLTVARVRFREVAGFAVLIARSRGVSIEQVEVFDSGSRNAAGRNNTTGGILLEEGTADFRVIRCNLRAVRGNGIWTHSLYTSPRNTRGLIRENRIEQAGRDAIQVGHATDIRVEQNQGSQIGFPAEDVDVENRAIPVAIDTAGNVERTAYVRNRFAEVNGKCIDLDGFHNGEIRGNECVNREPPGRYRFGNYGIVMNNSNPDMQSRNIHVVGNLIDSPLFGGIFVIGSGHLVEQNRLINLNTAHCNEDAVRFGCYYAPGEPDMLRSGIYLGRGAERPAPAQDNIVRNNQITGFKMNARCIALAPGIPPGSNVVRGNRCRE
jgi:hypothetical protein